MNESPVEAINLSVIDKLRLLLDITKKISRSLDLQEVLNLVMDTLGSLLPYDAAGIYVLRSDKPEPTPHSAPETVFRTEAVRGYDIDDLTEIQLKIGEGLIGHVALTGEPVISADVRDNANYVNARAKTRSEMVAPIISNNEVIGVFDLESDQINAFSADDLEILLLLASQVAIIIEKVMLHEQMVEKKRLQGQLEVARQVQLSLLPARNPQLEGFDIAAYNFSTEEVSGDYYDFVYIYDDQLGLVLADVSGKGVPAALLMAFLRASLRAAIQNGYSPYVSMSKVNFQLWETIDRNQFVTAFFGILDGHNRTLAFTNAGHNPALIIDADGGSRLLKQGGVPLGMFKETRYYEYYLSIESGQTLVLYTDGATEASNEDGEEYGLERLERIVRAEPDKNSRELIQAIYSDILDFTGGRRPDDDVTLIIVKAL